MILVLRSESPEAYIAIIDGSGAILREHRWEAGRQMSMQLPRQIDRLLDGVDASYADLAGVIAYEGPGSFTGLRIGLTIANAIAHESNIPIVGSTGDDWINQGLSKLKTAKPGTILTPVYGGEANITKPKK